MMKVAVDIKAGSLFQDLTTCIKKDDFLSTAPIRACKTLNEWPHKPGNTD